MTLVITELRDDFPLGPDPSFNPNIFSEDEEEQQQQSPTHKPPHSKSSRYHMNDHQSAPPIAPMSPRPNRFPSRPRNSQQQSPLACNSSNSQRPPIPQLGPLAKAESYEDEEEVISSHTESRNCQGSSYSRIVSQYSRSSSTSSNQSRVAISPLYCEGSVPQLQSPKNAVAPSDIIFDRPPAGGQTTLMSYSSNTDYTNNVVQVKNALTNHDHSSRTNAHVTPVPLNLNLNLERVEKVRPSSANTGVVRKQKDLQFIDEETPSKGSMPATGTVSRMKRTPTVISISPAGIPDSITRSCSVGYLDDVEMVPSDVALSMLRKETPYKRLVLVDKKRQRKKRLNENMNKRQRLRPAIKSKSLDFGDIIDAPNIRQDLLNLFQQMPKVSESSENDDASSSDHNTTSPAAQSSSPSPIQQPSTSSKFNFKNNLKERFSGYSRTPILNRKERPKSCSICKQISPTVHSKETVCATCRASVCVSSPCTPKHLRKSLHEHQSQSFDLPGTSTSSVNRTSLGSSLAKSNIEKKSAAKRNVEIVTSFTDSPLFSRKHRHGSLTETPNMAHVSSGNSNSINRHHGSESNTPMLGRRHSKIGKDGSESRRRQKQNHSSDTIETELLPVEVTPIEPRSYVSLHTQVNLFSLSLHE